MDFFIDRTGEGEKLLFIHGAGGSSKFWYFQREYLKDGFDTILVDLPGHGIDVDGEGMSSIDEYKDYVRSIIKALEIERSFIIGHSMGGAIAMSFALDFPEMLKGIVLITTGAKLKVYPEILEGLKKDKENTVKMIMEYAFWHKSPDYLKENSVKEMMKCKKEVILGDFIACNEFNIMDKLQNIRIPALIVAGKYDLLTPPKFSEYLHREIKGSHLEIIDKAGHMVALEQPNILNTLIKNWVLAVTKSFP